MRFSTLALIAAAAVLAFFVAMELWWGQPDIETEPAPRQPAVAPAETQPPVRYPVPGDRQPGPATEVDAAPRIPDRAAGTDPGAYLRQMLHRLVPEGRLQALLLSEDFIPKLVLVVDNLPRKTIPRQHLPLRPPQGEFMAEGPEGETYINPGNFDRYLPYVRLAEAVPLEGLAAVYFELYPEFQEAYRQMGYPDRYFNDRLVEVLEHLIATPLPDLPIRVEPHINRYLFADPDLEARSAGQKILLRMGPDNARRIKERLRELRTILVQQEPGAEGGTTP